MITLYFLFSICWTLISMAWFITCNHYTTKAEMPNVLLAFCEFLQQVFCCCFPLTKTNEKDAANKTTIAAADDETVTCVYCRQLFGSCCRKTNRVKDGNKKESHEQAMVSTDDSSKEKCQLCDRCQSCQADFDKDKAKGKTKKEIEAKCSALNYFIFILIFLFMFISNMVIWLLMAQ